VNGEPGILASRVRCANCLNKFPAFNCCGVRAVRPVDGAVNGFFPDAYGEVLDYYTGDYSNPRSNVANIAGVNSSAVTAFNTGGSGDSYAGNIKAASWFSQKTVASGASSAPNAYVYQYDNKYQLVGGSFSDNLTFGSGPATYATTNKNQEVIGNSASNIPPYDGNGNIQYLQRTSALGAVTDQFSYQYSNGNNQLTQVTNVATSQPFATYTYDLNGQLSMENKPGSNPMYLSYDVTGKVTGVYQDQQHTVPVVTFAYDENGMRVKKVDYSTGTNQPTMVTYYVGDVTYRQMVTNGSYGTASPIEYYIRGTRRIGIYSPQGPTYAYELTDHLGSVRAVVTQNASTMQVTAYSDYYPFGYVLAQGGSDRYGYQGQFSEFDGETGWNAFQLRMYDSRIGRWLQYDPAGQFLSPYLGMGNDPVKGIDKDGGFWQELVNFISMGKWISNEALTAYEDLQSQDADVSQENYEWFGSRLKGHGVLTWYDYEKNDSGVVSTVMHRKTYEAQRDFFQTIGGRTYAVYPDFEVSATAGLRVKLDLAEAVDLDLNLISAPVFKYSFVENKIKSVYNDDFKFTSGAELAAAGMGVGMELEYDSKGVKFEGSAIMGVKMSVAKELMEKEAGATIGISKSFAGGVGLVLEAKFGTFVEEIPKSDIDAWMKKE